MLGGKVADLYEVRRYLLPEKSVHFLLPPLVPPIGAGFDSMNSGIVPTMESPSGAVGRVRLSCLRAALIALVATGCATALSSFQPAHVAPKGHVQSELGFDISYPTASIQKTLEAARALEEAAGERSLTDEEVFVIFEGGANLAANPVTVIPHLGAAYGIFERTELGLRFAATGWRLGVRRQLATGDDGGLDLSLGLGFGRSAFAPPIHSVLSTVELEDFSRWTVDLPVTVGRQGIWYRWWLGPRLLYSSLSTHLTVTLPAEDVRVAGTVSGDALYIGGFAGAAFGFRSVFVGPELTLVQLVGNAEVNALARTVSSDLNSFMIYPAFAVMGEF